MTTSRGLLKSCMSYTTEAFTPNALASKGAANTRTETTRPIMQARRPNSVSSPPHNIAPPAIAMPIRPIAYATGPVSDVAMAVIGLSHGKLPPAAAWARTANAHISVIRAASLEPKFEDINLRTKFIFGDLPGLCLSVSDVLNLIPAILVSGYEQNFPDLAPRFQFGLFINENDQIDCFGDQGLLR
jgi:hypothetical protein